jgi:hypothetical protein
MRIQIHPFYHPPVAALVNPLMFGRENIPTREILSSLQTTSAWWMPSCPFYYRQYQPVLLVGKVEKVVIMRWLTGFEFVFVDRSILT